MSYTPLVRWRNFTIGNLKALLEVYPDLTLKADRTYVENSIEEKLSGYKRTAYQFGCQLGIESKKGDFKTQNYLYCLDDEGLEKYMGFWFKMYVCPNPYVNSFDTPICPFVEIAKQVLNSDNHKISFSQFCKEAFGEGKSTDIFKNALALWGKPLQIADDIISINSEDIDDLKEMISKVSATLPMNDNKDMDEFFERFCSKNFAEFYDLSDCFCNAINVYKEIITEEVPNNLSIEDLGKILSEMYGNHDSINPTGVRMFGLKYGKYIRDKNYSIPAITDAAGLQHSYYSEINKGVQMYESIAKNEFGIRFYEEKKGDGKNLTGSVAKGGINKIFYGAPGCGKSHYVNKMLQDAGVSDENIFRVTFHPEYLNCDFVGQILPTIEEKEDPNTKEKKEIVKYQFNPGPFTLALRRAYSTRDMVYLVIEEINRGNAAAIFGDLFQLLDRVKDVTKVEFSSSEYPIRNVCVQDYLVRVGDQELLVETQKIKTGIRIPGNLTIFATMNSCDQNVFTLDTAFKRRWAFEQISNDIIKDNDHQYKKWYIPGTSVTWEEFLTKLNNKILEYKIYSQTNEDKRLGKYFVTKDCLTEEVKAISDVEEVAESFAYKVLEYVWNDVCKIGREDWFDTQKYRTLEDLIEAFKNPADGKKPLDIFQNIVF